MISQEQLWQTIWPIVEQTLHATVAADHAHIQTHLQPASPAAALHDLFGATGMALLLKTSLGREDVALTRAIHTDEGVFVEYAWPVGKNGRSQTTAADLVTVQLQPASNQWHIHNINPASLDTPLTTARARGVLMSNRALVSAQGLPTEPWLLPVAFFAGSLQPPLRPQALADDIERLFLPGMQQRGYGAPLLLRGRQLWRDFVAAAQPPLSKPAAWATAVEFIMSEQDLREITPAAVGKHYRTTLAKITPRVREIKQLLQIAGQDERYTDLQATKIMIT
ncbi:MAG: hypothetical protein R3C62_22220 [Chloroflexota bacterium]